MKRCSRCNTQKELTNYYYNSYKKQYWSYCKKCNSKEGKLLYQSNKEVIKQRHRENYQKNKVDIKNRHKNNRLNLKDGYYYVYCLLDKGFYVGQTDCIKWRNYTHKSKDIMILHKCTSRKEALWYEAVYHDIGFSGK